jgi:hypothetical protein
MSLFVDRTRRPRAGGDRVAFACRALDSRVRGDDESGPGTREKP